MSGLAGTLPLARLALRRDRITVLVWVLAITAGAVGIGYTMGQAYPRQAQRAMQVVAGERNPALVFLFSKLHGDSIGALTAWRYGLWGAILAALMSIFVVVRHTRADEDAGRAELVGSAAIGRRAPLSAALGLVVAANVLLAGLVTSGLVLVGLPGAGAAALALSMGVCGVTFASIAAFTAQVASDAQGARGIALGALGAAYLLQAVGDSATTPRLSWLSWLSPLGWTEHVQPFARERWWVLALPAGAAAITGVAAYMLADRRDHGAGLLPTRPGRAGASGLLSGVFGLGWRLQRGRLAGWVAAFGFAGTIFGAAGKGIRSLLGGSPEVRDVLNRFGGQAAFTNAYLAAIVLLTGMVAAAYAVSAVLQLRSEETGGLAEPVLATATGRLRWALSHVGMAVAGTAALLAGAGLAIGLGYGLRAGDLGSEVQRLLVAALAQLPASLALAGVAVMLLGVLPRACVGVGWATVVAVLAVKLFGAMLRFPQWVLDISPFTHVPRLPGGVAHATALLWLSLIALGLMVIGLGALRRRDLA